MGPPLTLQGLIFTAHLSNQKPPPFSPSFICLALDRKTSSSPTRGLREALLCHGARDRKALQPNDPAEGILNLLTSRERKVRSWGKPRTVGRWRRTRFAGGVVPKRAWGMTRTSVPMFCGFYRDRVDFSASGWNYMVWADVESTSDPSSLRMLLCRRRLFGFRDPGDVDGPDLVSVGLPLRGPDLAQVGRRRGRPTSTTDPVGVRSKRERGSDELGDLISGTSTTESFTTRQKRVF